MHHVLYEWSELVEIDKHVEQLELAIASIDQLAKSLYKFQWYFFDTKSEIPYEHEEFVYPL